MTSEQLSALQQYVNTVKDLMGLKDWTIEVRDKALDDPDIIAQVKHTEGRKFARVYVGEKWREQDAEGKRAAIADVIAPYMPLPEQANDGN